MSPVCGGLNENGPDRLIYLNVLTVQEGLGERGLVGGDITGGGGRL